MLRNFTVGAAKRADETTYEKKRDVSTKYDFFMIIRNALHVVISQKEIQQNAHTQKYIKLSEFETDVAKNLQKKIFSIHKKCQEIRYSNYHFDMNKKNGKEITFKKKFMHPFI